MQLREIYQIADEIAPKRLSDEICQNPDWYDNSGILLDTGEEIKRVLFSLDLSVLAVEKALQTGANLIITHHPAIYGKISSVRYDDEQMLGGKLVKCLRNGISVLSMHLNLDFASDGIDESLMQGILLSAGAQSTDGKAEIHCPVFGGGYGRVYDVPKITVQTLAENMKKTFSSERVERYPNGVKSISKVASFCGSGADESAVLFAKAQGADAIVSSDFKHHVLTLARECGLAVITLTHYASEHYGFKKYYEKIRRQIEIPCEYYTDEELL